MLRPHVHELTSSMHGNSRAPILFFPSSFHTHKSSPRLGMVGLMVMMILHRLGFSFMKPPALAMVPMMVLLSVHRLGFSFMKPPALAMVRMMVLPSVHRLHLL